jgi:NADPH:quinone reductase-like Zn-dependent oxidoreductase
MRAIVHDGYGSPDVLSVREIDKPAIKADQVLVRVHAAGLHIGDCFGVEVPNPCAGYRLLAALCSRIRRGGLGRGEANNVTPARGDEVFGACKGACAEYASADEDKLALKPTNLALEAAAIPTSALAALTHLRRGKVEPGQRV